MTHPWYVGRSAGVAGLGERSLNGSAVYDSASGMRIGEARCAYLQAEHADKLAGSLT